MSSTRVRATFVVLALSAFISSGALAGCSVSRDDKPGAAPDTASAEPTPTPEPSATVTVTTTPVPSPSTSPSTPATPADALLSAAELPQLNPSARWTERRTGSAGQRPFGLCQRFDLLSIGAESVVERTYAHGKATAGQQVAVFPDAQNAVRASKVIEAWHRDCASRTEARVGPISDVAVPQGKGWWYLASSERQGVGHFHALGLALTGTRMSLVRMDVDGQDHDYAPGKDPVELAVKAISARLG